MGTIPLSFLESSPINVDCLPSGNLKKGNLGPENAFLYFLPLLSSNLVIEMQKNAEAEAKAQ